MKTTSEGSLLTPPIPNWERITKAIQNQKSKIKNYIALTKPGITLAVVVTTLAGFLLGTRGSPTNWILLLHTLLGTGFVAAGAGTLNMLLEADLDTLMNRTRHRPLPAGRLRQEEVFLFGLMLSAAGLIHLASITTPYAGCLAALSLTIYLLIYTPLKTKTAFCTVPGAVSGALPPVIGWTAAHGSLGWEALVLFLILFLWQFPHLLALTWIYREDYDHAGIRMVPTSDVSGTKTSFQALFLSVMLLLASLIPFWMEDTKSLYLYGAISLGLLLLGASFRFHYLRSKTSAKHLF
ncbi:MAG: protoheme IX farnesyltransferase, partial [Elusimicrobia bacterium]|nr:protoheme IX farnesyltransferase [Elusimicrobiota bacterium]